nr:MULTISPECIES: putative sulfate exporter family transporter [unclassified Mesorhizobium]
MSSATHIANDIPTSPISADLAAGRKRLDSAWNGIIPGIVLVAMITAVAFSTHNVSGFALFSPMILAVVSGTIYSNVLGLPAHAKAGIAFSQKRLLRFAIVLLGFQLTFGQVSASALAASASSRPRLAPPSFSPSRSAS